MQINAKNDELPPCTCGATSWRSGSSRGGSHGMESFHVCNGCERVVLELYREGGNALLGPSSGEFTEAENDYINGPLMVTWRDHAAQVDVWMRERTKDDIANVNAALGLPLDTKGDTIPQELYSVWSKALDAADADARAAMPDDVARTPVPPQLPVGMIAYIRQRGSRVWERVSAEESSALPIPSDPTWVAHDKAYRALFAALRKRYGEYCDVVPCEVPNQYSASATNRPWYVLDLQPGVTLTIGPRHSVISIAVASTFGDLDVRRLAAAAERDGVTYSGMRPKATREHPQIAAISPYSRACSARVPLYGGDKHGAYIHAYGMDKALEYAALALVAALRLDR